jgi:hypothetical protein
LFAGGSVVHPERPLRTLDADLAWLAGLELGSGLLGTMRSALWLQLQPYVLETVAIWTTARVAGVRTSGGEGVPSYVYLLRRGEQLLGSVDPVATLRGWLPAEPDLR